MRDTSDLFVCMSRDGPYSPVCGRIDVYGVILQAPLHSPGTEHFPSLGLISSQRKYLLQVNTTPRPLSYPLCPSPLVPRPGACLALNPRISPPQPLTPSAVPHLCKQVCRLKSSDHRLAPAPAPATLDVVLHASLVKPFSPPCPSNPSVSNLILSTYHQV